MIMPRKAMAAVIAVVVVFSGAAALYMFALPGLSSAQPQPPEMEVAVAMWLLRHSVPASCLDYGAASWDFAGSSPPVTSKPIYQENSFVSFAF
jgi:hypothetical protein